MSLRHLELRDVNSHLSKSSDHELLATKLMVPSPPRVLIARPRLSALLNEGLQLITEQAIHDAFRFLLEHQPEHLHVFLLTRADPPFLLGRLRALGQVLELRIDQLRFTSQEAATFLTKAMGFSLEAEAIQAVEARTEGWIASLQLAALSFRGQTDPTDLLTRLRGDHRYILDYLTDEVLRQQRTAIQHFLHATSILERLSAPLCDAVMQQNGSPLMAALLSKLREQERKKGPTPYLDSLLAAFFPERRANPSAKTGEDVSRYPLLDPLSERELDVLRLLAQGASNQEIAEILVVALSTVKHHVSMILSKLGASNRTQAVAQARALGLLSDEP